MLLSLYNITFTNKRTFVKRSDECRIFHCYLHFSFDQKVSEQGENQIAKLFVMSLESSGSNSTTIRAHHTSMRMWDVKKKKANLLWDRLGANDFIETTNREHTTIKLTFLNCSRFGESICTWQFILVMEITSVCQMTFLL